MEAIRAAAEARAAAAEQRAAIAEQVRTEAEAGQRVRAADAEREKASQAAAGAEAAARLASHAAISDPETFFTALGEQAAGEIASLRAQMRAQVGNPPGEDYLARVARLNALRKQAGEIVPAGLILLSPGLGASKDDPAAPA